METFVSVVCDNTVGRSDFLGEHGWSCLIERGSERYLFDTGQGLTISHNLKSLEKSLDGLSLILISHGHYDHTGGLKWVLTEAKGAQIVAHPGIFERHSVKDVHGSGKIRYIGCPFTRQELEDLGADFRFFHKTVEVCPGMWFITGIERNPKKVPHDPRLVIQSGDEIAPDPVADDSSLLIDTDQGLVLIMGCAHSGILNLMDYVQDAMGINTLFGVMGGTHLAFSDSHILSQMIEKLEALSVQLIGVSHCTGFEAAAAIYNYFPTRVSLASAGKSFRI